jgi:hypothetical protein
MMDQLLMECGSNKLNGDCGLITYWWSVGKRDVWASSDLVWVKWVARRVWANTWWCMKCK